MGCAATQLCARWVARQHSFVPESAWIMHCKDRFTSIVKRVEAYQTEAIGSLAGGLLTCAHVSGRGSPRVWRHSVEAR